VEKIINKICRELPEGWTLSLDMENGAAWVSLERPGGAYCKLPDATDKTLVEQLNYALRVACD